MATTPNYGFIMPDPTDFVTDLPADFEIFGDAVDARIKALNPETTLGDISYRSSTADTNTRLPIGTSGQVLAVSGGVPAWTTISSGGMTSLATGSLSGASTSLTGISGSFRDLKLVLRNPKSSSTSNIRLQFNSQTGGIYNKLNNATFANGFDPTSTMIDSINIAAGIWSTTNNGICVVDLYDYANTVTWKTGAFNMAANNSATSATIQAEDFFFFSTSAITSIQINTSAGSWNGGTYILYGVS